MAKNPSKKRPHLFTILAAIISLAVLASLYLGFRLFTSSQSTPTSPISFGVFPKVAAQQATTSAKPPVLAQQAINQSPPTGPSGRSGVPILMYHYVGNNPNPTDRQRDILSITPDRLDAELNWLAQNGYTPITLDTLYGLFAKKENIAKPVVLTFDDGYIDFYINAFPILQKYNFHAVAFIPTGLIGGPYYMTWDQIKAINSSGLISFEAHTVHHANLPSLSYAQMLGELKTSKSVLEAQTGATVNFIAYPYGASNSLVWQAAKEAGFVGGVGTWTGRAAGPGINMPRIKIPGGTTLANFAAKVAY